jgi:hypothetical protein
MLAMERDGENVKLLGERETGSKATWSANGEFDESE